MENSKQAIEAAHSEAAQGMCSLCGAEINTDRPWLQWCATCKGSLADVRQATLLAGLAMLAACVVIFQHGWALYSAASVGFLGLLAAISHVDLKLKLIPDEFAYALIWSGLVFNLLGTQGAMAESVMGAILGYGILWGLYWAVKLTLKEESLGYGDFKLLAGIGAWLGAESLGPVLAAAGLVSLLVPVAQWASTRFFGAFEVLVSDFDVVDTQDESPAREVMPFGPMLALGAAFYLMYKGLL